MEQLIKCIFILLLGFWSIKVHAQSTQDEVLTDSVSINKTEPVKVHLPRKATVYSAVLPGLGQIYNRQWWKVPFVYGGFAGIGYMIGQYNDRYRLNKQAYLDLMDKNPLTNSYIPYTEIEIDETSPPSDLQNAFLSKVTDYGRQRDLYVIVAVGFYLLNILDANVNAHFIDFDISEDLSLNITPLTPQPFSNHPIPGFTLVYNF